MANGRPGDHPFTDILLHGGSEFGDPVDSLVRQMASAPGFEAVRGEVADLLWELSPMDKPAEREQLVREAQRRLLVIRARGLPES